MKKRVTKYSKILAIAVFLCGFSVAYRAGASIGSVASSPDQTPAAQEAPVFDQQKAIADITKSIAGQESKPAEEVFKNIQLFKGMPAARLLRVMEIAMGKSLGVNCTHCHVPGEWDKEDKPAKQIARDMFGMVGKINNDLLKNVKNLKGPNPTINCTTCHRGQVKPALNLP